MSEYVGFCEECDAAIVSERKEDYCISCQAHEFKKGGNKGSISYQNGEKPYLAVTATKSNWYKTYRGAANYMEKMGYKRCK